MSDRKCLCNHWVIKEHGIDITKSGPVKTKCSKCECMEACLP